MPLASEGTARIGGALAVNSGGLNVLRYGMARDLCLGIEAVLADGSVLSGLKPLRKDNTGYDLRHLLIGSEGTLGVITAAALKLFPLPGETVTAMLAVPSPEAALALLHDLRERLGDGVTAFELIAAQSIRFLRHFYPERPDLVRRAQEMAQSLGGTLPTPQLSVKYAWIQKLFGWSAAKRTQARYNLWKARARRALDGVLHQLEGGSKRWADKLP